MSERELKNPTLTQVLAAAQIYNALALVQYMSGQAALHGVALKVDGDGRPVYFWSGNGGVPFETMVALFGKEYQKGEAVIVNGEVFIA
jgi:hypothetical protein